MQQITYAQELGTHSLSKLISSSKPHQTQDTGHSLCSLPCCILGLLLSHTFFFFMSSFFILGKGHLLSTIVQWKDVAFFLISTEAYGKICLASCRRLWFGIYETCWICEDYWNSWDGLNAYCIMRLRLSFPEARGWTLRFKGIPWVR